MRHYVIMKVGNSYAKVPVEIRRLRGGCEDPQIPVEPMDNYVTYETYVPTIEEIEANITRLLSKQLNLDNLIDRHKYRLELLESIYNDSEFDIEAFFDIEDDLNVLRLSPGGLHLKKDETNENGERFKAVFFGTTNPLIEKFILERYDEETSRWVPFDNENGIVI